MPFACEARVVVTEHGGYVGLCVCSEPMPTPAVTTCALNLVLQASVFTISGLRFCRFAKPHTDAPALTNTLTIATNMYQLLLLAAFLFSFCGFAQAADRPKPNIILFLIDDLGWRDLGCQGSTFYQTPNIDRLAQEGVRFTDAYSACAVCSPTRAAILTGKYPARLLLTNWLPAGRWDPNAKLREGRFLRGLPVEELTLAEALREAGYRTANVGKWHLGSEPFSLPEHHGFDVNIAGNAQRCPEVTSILTRAIG